MLASLLIDCHYSSVFILDRSDAKLQRTDRQIVPEHERDTVPEEGLDVYVMLYLQKLSRYSTVNLPSTASMESSPRVHFSPEAVGCKVV